MQEPATPLSAKVDVAGSCTGFIGTDPPHLNPAA
jgi:hypothetical protein